MTVTRIIKAVGDPMVLKQITEDFRAVSQHEHENTVNPFSHVTWSGIFSPDRKPENLLTHSGLVALHLEPSTPERLTRIRIDLQSKKYVHVLLSDILGTGLIVVFAVQCTNLHEHNAFARQLTDYLKDCYRVLTIGAEESELDPSSLAVDWLCPIAHDGDVYYQPNSDIIALLPEYKPQLEQTIPNDEPIIPIPTAFNSLTDDLHAERERAQERINEGPSETETEWNEPQPLNTTLLSVLSVHDYMLPEPLRDWLTDIAHRMKCPLDFVASACVVMLSSLIGTRLAIKPKGRDDWTIVVNLWGAAVGDPSMKKTPAMMEVLKPLKRLEAEAKKAFDQADLSYQAEQVSYEAQKRVYQSQEQDRLKGKVIENPVLFPEQPKKPTEHRYMTNDATVEKVADLLNENPSGLLQFRDELVGLLASWERSGHEMDRAFYLEAWNGNDSKTVDRIGRGTTHVGNVCISLMGGIQPSKLLGYLQAATGYENDGFVQRLQLAVYPDKPTWELIDEYPNKSARDKAFSLIQKIAESDFATIGYPADDYNKFSYTRFDPDAQKVFYEFLTEMETKIVPNESGLLQEHFAKYGSLMPSLALVFHVANCLSGEQPTTADRKSFVSVEAAKMAVAWCKYLESHARRIYGLLDTASVEGARALLQRIKQGKLSNGFKVRDVVRMNWSFLTSSHDVELALAELINKGYLREQSPALSTGGRPEAPCYLIHPKFSSNV